MKFLSVTISNFLTVQAPVTLYLADRGLNLLQGINEADSSAASNGAGKSTLADALCWALYGATARDASGDQVVNNVAKKGTGVAVLLQDGATQYRISRFRKHPQHKNSTVVEQIDAAGAVVDLSKGTEKETQAVIEQILGCSLDVFKGAIYAGQEQMPDLPGLTDKALKVLIEEAAGVKQLEAAYEVARKKTLNAEREYTAVVAQVENVESHIKTETTSKQIAELKHADFEKGRAERAQVFYDQADVNKQGAAGIIAVLRKSDQVALELERTTLTETAQGAQAAQAAQAAYFKAQVQPATTVLTQAQTMYAMRLKEAQAIKGVLDNAEAEMAKPCGACGKPHTANELEQFKAHQTQLLRDKVAEAQRVKAMVEQATAKLDETRTEHDRLVRLIPDVSAAVTKIQSLTTQIETLEKQKAEVIKLATAAQNLVSKGDAAKCEANPQQAVIEQCDQRIATHAARIASLQGEVSDKKKAMEIAQSVTSVFSPAGVRAHILDTVTPFLNERTAHYLSTLSDGNLHAIWSTLTRNAKGEAREKFGIEVANAEGGESFALISGGEKRKVRLACMLALQDLVASRATKNIELWLGDEVDDAMDEAGLERLMAILEQKAREKGTVVVISHNSLRDWIDETTVVRKVARGDSRVEGALTVAS